MKHYFLFGEDISRTYLEEDFDKVIAEIKEGHVDWDIYYFDDGENDLELLLLAYTGWGGFATITEEEFQQLIELKLNEEN